VWRFVRSDEAMTATEYAVMLALIVCLCMGPVQTLGCRANQSFTNTSNSIGS
jgi:pilus assembly protein Flp/PilA